MSLGAQFQQIVADQAPDWSDMYFALVLPDELRLDEARLLMAPAQLERTPGRRDHFTFRVSHTRGYGCFADLAEACLGKVDTAGIGGKLELIRVLYAVDTNWTQGPTHWDEVKTF
jgi:hypothetical protein